MPIHAFHNDSWATRLGLVPLLAVALVLAHNSLNATEVSAGGAGIMQPVGLQQQCFTTRDGLVTQVCGSFQIGWKLWTLAGEPISDFTLQWELQDITISPDHKGKGKSHQVGTLPAPLSRAAKQTELYLEGIAFLNMPHSLGVRYAALPFNTGVAVRPSVTGSMNVPGGHNWEKFLLRSNAPGQNWCVAKGREYLDAAGAKAVMRAGVTISRFELCASASTVDVSALTAAIARLCGDARSGNPQFCGPRTQTGLGTSPQMSALDKVADRPVLLHKLQELRDKYEENAAEACRRQFEPIERCIVRAACAKPDEPPERECQAIPTRPKDELSDSCKDRPLKDNGPTLCVPTLHDRGGREWDQRWKELSSQCKARNHELRRAAEQCDSEASAKCNPKAISVASCVRTRMSNAPTEADAEKALGLHQSTVTGKRSTAQPSFLD